MYGMEVRKPIHRSFKTLLLLTPKTTSTYAMVHFKNSCAFHT